MTSTHESSPALTEQPTAPQRETSAPLPISDYKGRVRTGCLVCRARKIKCDEQRPNCQKCTKLGKACVYRTRNGRKQSSMPSVQISGTFDLRNKATEASLPSPVHVQLSSPSNPIRLDDPEALRTYEDVVQLDSPNDTYQDGPPESTDVTTSLNQQTIDFSCPGKTSEVSGSSPSRSQLASQIISITFSMDSWQSSGPLSPSSFSYFLDEVDIPTLSPFDILNWKRAKMHIVRLGLQVPPVAVSVLAIQALYRSQVERLPVTHAMSLYQAAASNFASMVGDDAISFDVVLTVAFLLCLIAFILPNEDNHTLYILEERFTAKLETSLADGCLSDTSMRFGAWLQLLDTAAKRGGSPSLLPDPVLHILQDHIQDVPSLRALDCAIQSENLLYDDMADPMLSFYLKVQKISNRVADLSHYRRSRTTSADQMEVEEVLTTERADLNSLWRSRPGLLRLQPAEIRKHLHPTISEPLLSVVGIYLAAYFAEIVAFGRTLGDPPFPSDEAKQALIGIRDIVEGDWNASNGHALNPGYLRPLFLYGVESFEEEDTQWAADRLRQIRDPLSRSGFLASFLSAHGEEQRKQQRRVTVQYFCSRTFGIPLPFM